MSDIVVLDEVTDTNVPAPEAASPDINEFMALAAELEVKRKQIAEETAKLEREAKEKYATVLPALVQKRNELVAKRDSLNVEINGLNSQISLIDPKQAPKVAKADGEKSTYDKRSLTEYSDAIFNVLTPGVSKCFSEIAESLKNMATPYESTSKIRQALDQLKLAGKVEMTGNRATARYLRKV